MPPGPADADTVARQQSPQRLDEAKFEKRIPSHSGVLSEAGCVSPGNFGAASFCYYLLAEESSHALYIRWPPHFRNRGSQDPPRKQHKNTVGMNY